MKPESLVSCKSKFDKILWNNVNIIRHDIYVVFKMWPIEKWALAQNQKFRTPYPYIISTGSIGAVFQVVTL